MVIDAGDDVVFGGEGIFVLSLHDGFDGSSAGFGLGGGEVAFDLAGGPAFFDDLRENFLDSLLVARNQWTHDAFSEFLFDHDFFGGFWERKEPEGVLDGLLGFADFGSDLFGSEVKLIL